VELIFTKIIVVAHPKSTSTARSPAFKTFKTLSRSAQYLVKTKTIQISVADETVGAVCCCCDVLPE
jgi:hypothetical protein